MATQADLARGQELYTPHPRFEKNDEPIPEDKLIPDEKLIRCPMSLYQFNEYLKASRDHANFEKSEIDSAIITFPPAPDGSNLNGTHYEKEGFDGVMKMTQKKVMRSGKETLQFHGYQYKSTGTIQLKKSSNQYEDPFPQI